MNPILRWAALCLLGLAAAAAGAADLRPWTGGAPPALELRAPDGSRHRLADYRGKVILVNFWATWCEPCREEMPSMQRLQERLSGRPFVVLAVNLDEPEARIRRFLAQMKVDFTVLLDPGKKAARAWDARILPASFLIGPDGRIQYRVVGKLDWEDARVAGHVAALLPAAVHRRE